MFYQLKYIWQFIITFQVLLDADGADMESGQAFQSFSSFIDGAVLFIKFQASAQRNVFVAMFHEYLDAFSGLFSYRAVVFYKGFNILLFVVSSGHI